MRKNILRFILIVLGFIAISYTSFPDLLSGKIVNQSDIAGWQGMSHEMMEWNKAHPDNETAWTDSMFGGMPTTTIHSSTKGDWTQGIYDFLLIGKRPATYLFISLLGAFLMFLAFGVNIWVAVFGALAVSFCSYNFQIIQVGHNTKMQAIAFMPWVIAAFVFTFNSAKKDKYFVKTALGAALFGLCLSFQVKANHPQISYYLALLLLIFAISILIDFVKNKILSHFLVSCALLLALGGLGIGTNAIKLLPTLEYTPYSMRGGSSDGSGEKGLELDYATAWSYGWEEIPNLLIPNFNGGSSAGAAPKNSETVALLKASGQSNIKQLSKNLPMYWGPQPFTAGPMYIGAITVFLFVLGLCTYKGKHKWWIIVCSILALFLSLGSHFMAFTKFFYNYIPLYNKFRTVSMALVILQLTFPLLGFIALDKYIVDDEFAAKIRSKRGLLALGLTAGFCFICALVPEIAGNFISGGDGSYPDVLREAFEADRRSLLRSDALWSGVLICFAYLCLFFGSKAPKSAPKTFTTQPEMRFARRRTFAIIVGVGAFASLFVVDKRYLSSDDFVSEKSFKNQFALRNVDKAILEDTDQSFRVLDLTVNVFNDSHPSYWHKNIGGYSPAKLARYQEYIESHLTSEINAIAESLSEAKTLSEAEQALPFLEGLARLNCKYIIIGDDYPPLEYPFAKGAAWFEITETTEIQEAQVTSESIVSENEVEMLSYEPNRLTYRYNSASGGRIVFSEVYYPKGWKLSLDGKEIDIELYGELFRSAVVPSGEGTLVMSFEPESYAIGEKVSRVSSIILIIILLSSLVAAGLPQLKIRKKEK